jgi:hypothetical protein
MSSIYTSPNSKGVNYVLILSAQKKTPEESTNANKSKPRSGLMALRERILAKLTYKWKKMQTIRAHMALLDDPSSRMGDVDTTYSVAIGALDAHVASLSHTIAALKSRIAAM